MKLKKVKHSHVSFIITLVFVLFILVSVSFFIWNDQNQKKEIMRLLNITPVPSMKITNYHKEGAMDWFIQVKIVIDHKYLNEFLANSPFKDKKLSSEKEFIDINPPKWWKPNKANKFLSCEYSDMEKVEYYRIYINLDDEEKDIIFIQWHET